MPKLKQRKDGGYFIHKSGDNHPITFQVTDEGADIVLTSGRDLEDFFPDKLFYLLYDLDHLDTKGAKTPDNEIGNISNIDWAVEELSLEDRVQVAVQIAETHGVRQLLQGDAAKWVNNLLGERPILLDPLAVKVCESAGFSYETVQEYTGSYHTKASPLKASLCLYLQHLELRKAMFNVKAAGAEIHGSTDSHVYISIQNSEETTEYLFSGDIPDTVENPLRQELREVWNHGTESFGFSWLHATELEHRFETGSGIVLPRERLEDFPIQLPPRSELTEQYEAFRILRNTVKHVLESPDSNVEHGDNSYCDQWYMYISERISEGADGIDGLGEQQRDRVGHTMQFYRDCYGDGEQVTDFYCVEWSYPSESEQLQLFGFGIFEHSDEVEVPVTPESEEPLPVYPQSKQDLDRGIQLLSEFPGTPDTGVPPRLGPQ